MEITMKKLAIALTSIFLLLPTVAFANPVTKTSKNAVYSVYQTDEDKFIIRLPVTGLDKSALDASMKGNVLTIIGTPAKMDLKIVRRGFVPSAFSTTFVLTKNAVVSEVTVTSGVLSIAVTVPLAEDQRTKKIPVR
jgi:HSP20 family molecular chaperone IbpA